MKQAMESDAWELLGWIMVALGIIITYITLSHIKTRKKLQQNAAETEGEWYEEQVKRASLLPPPGASLNPLEMDVMHAQLELERRKEILRRNSSNPPVPGRTFVPPVGHIPPPPPEIWEAMRKPWPTVIPPPPSDLNKKE